MQPNFAKWLCVSTPWGFSLVVIYHFSTVIDYSLLFNLSAAASQLFLQLVNIYFSRCIFRMMCFPSAPEVM